MKKNIFLFFALIALIATSACTTGTCGVVTSNMQPGMMSANQCGASVNDVDDRRTAASQAFNHGSGNALADSKGMKATATAANIGSGTADAKATDPFQNAVYSVQNKDGSLITAEDRTLASVVEKGGVSSAVAVNQTTNGRIATVSDRIFDLNKLGGMRMRVVEKKGWETNLNNNLHPHAAPILSTIEGGPSGIAHKDIEFMKLAPGTILFECTPAKNNFIYGLFAVNDLGPHAYNLMQNFALRSFVKGQTTDGAWVIGAYFYLSDRLVETDSPIVVAEAPWATKSERIQRQLSEYEKIMGRAADPTKPACPESQKSTSRGEEVKTIIDQR